MFNKLKVVAAVILPLSIFGAVNRSLNTENIAVDTVKANGTQMRVNGDREAANATPKLQT